MTSGLCGNADSLRTSVVTMPKNVFFSCAQCEERFACYGSLYRHMVIHRGTYKCSECGRCCGSGSELDAHRRSHSGEKPFECTVCGKRFRLSNGLAVHSRNHSTKRPFKCHVCDKAFKQYAHLNTHVRMHTGERPYKCRICNKAFSWSSGVTRHMRD